MKYAFINAAIVFKHSMSGHVACLTFDVNYTPTQKPLFPQAHKWLSSLQRKSRLCLISLISFLFSNGSRPKAQPLRVAAFFNQHRSHIGCLVLLQKHILIFLFLSLRNVTWHELKCSLHLTVGVAHSHLPRERIGEKKN